MEASLFARVTAEFGVFWEGHLAEQDVILGADPFSTGEDVTDARTKLPSIRHLVDRVMFTGMLSHSYSNGLTHGCLPDGRSV